MKIISNFFIFFCFSLILYVSINVFSAAYNQPLSFDDAFNLQPAKSLSETFIYQSTYFPRNIYDYRITSNGVMQYLAALDLRLLGNRCGLAFTMMLLAIFFMTSCLYHSYKTFGLLLVLLLAYPPLQGSLTYFLGESASIAFILLGIVFTEKYKNAVELHKKNLQFLIPAVICYGLAVATKLIAGIAIPFILFGCLYDSKRIDVRMFAFATRHSFCIYALSLATFVAFFYFSTAHSLLLLDFFGKVPSNDFVANPGLYKFIQHHFWQQQVATTHLMSPGSFSVPWVLPVLALSLALMIKSSRGWLPLAAFAVYLLCKSGLLERRILIFIFFILSMGVTCIESEIRDALSHANRFHAAFLAFPAILLLLSWGYVLLAVQVPKISKYTKRVSELYQPNFQPLINVFSNQDFREENFIISPKSQQMASIIRKINTPIIASGWWQFPDIQLVSGKSFYDRMNPEVQKRLEGSAPLLLYSSSNKTWPETSSQMCEEIVVEFQDLVLCKYDLQYPLNYRWPER